MSTAIRPKLRDHGMTLSMCYHDPDGNAVELQVDNFGSWEGSKQASHSTRFAKARCQIVIEPRFQIP